MNFKIFENNVLLYNQHEAVEHIMKAISMQAEEKSLIFSHMIIDGVEVYDDPMSYIEHNFNHIEEIEAILKTEEEVLGQYVLELYSILYQGLPQIVNLGKLFTVNINDKIWDEMDSFLKEMGILINVYNELLANYQTLTNKFAQINWHAIDNEFNIFTGAIAAMGTYIENQDTVVIADLILYEVLPAMEKVFMILGETINIKKEEES